MKPGTPNHQMWWPVTAIRSAYEPNAPPAMNDSRRSNSIMKRSALLWRGLRARRRDDRLDVELPMCFLWGSACPPAGEVSSEFLRARAPSPLRSHHKRIPAAADPMNPATMFEIMHPPTSSLECLWFRRFPTTSQYLQSHVALL
jgi:hypothetical protein